MGTADGKPVVIVRHADRPGDEVVVPPPTRPTEARAAAEQMFMERIKSDIMRLDPVPRARLAEWLSRGAGAHLSASGPGGCGFDPHNGAVHNGGIQGGPQGGQVSEPQPDPLALSTAVHGLCA